MENNEESYNANSNNFATPNGNNNNKNAGQRMLSDLNNFIARIGNENSGGGPPLSKAEEILVYCDSCLAQLPKGLIDKARRDLENGDLMNGSYFYEKCNEFQ